MRFNPTRKAPGVAQFASELRTHINNQGSSLASAEQTGQMISVESLNDANRASLENHFESVSADIDRLMGSIGLEAFDTTSAEGKRAKNTALMAGAIAAMAAGNPTAYAQAAQTVTVSAESGVKVVDSMLSAPRGMDYRTEAVSMEAFGDRELRDFLPYTIAFNVFASRQDDFSEAFYPTVVVTPDQTGLDVTVSRMLVFNEFKHAVTGKAADFKKKNLIDAVVDPTVLADESTRLVPVYSAESVAAFVPQTAVDDYEVLIAGVSVPTAPLLLGREVDLIGISTYQPLVGAQVMDHTDDIDARIALGALYLLPEAGEAAVKFNVSKLPRSTFQKSQEGNYREMNLHFSTAELTITKDTTDVTGAAVTAFAAITAGEYTVKIKATVNGTANVEIGNVSVYAAGVTVAGVYDSTGLAIDLTAGAGLAIKNTVEATSLIGYDLIANRTSQNKRTRGLQLDTTLETERYTIPLGAPISVPSPVTSNRDAADLKALIAAARIRNSNNAVTALLDYADQLKAYVANPVQSDSIPQVQGMGRFLVQPWFEEHNLDLEQSINTYQSHDKAADISAVLVNACRDVAYRAYRDSRYQAALDAVTGGTGELPTLVVGTDQVLARHLIVAGDTRTFGTTFEKYALKVSLDERVSNRIFLTFVRDKADGPDPLTFGTHAWIPELTSSIMVNRNGATIKEAMVQPRTLHVNNLPVLAVINVKNLSKVLTDKIAAPSELATVDNPWLDGLNLP